MAVVFDIVYLDDVPYKKTYSDKGFMIRQDSTGVEYAEAIDPYDTNRTYTETNIPIEPIENEEVPSNQTELEEIARILLGEEE